VTLRPDTRPLIAHVVYRFDIGGLENGVVNLINNLPADTYRHAVVSLTAITDFRRRVLRDDVEFLALDKPPGHTARIYPQLFRLFRRLRPSIVHSRNLAALETVVPAWAAGVPIRIHGEHGRDQEDVAGTRFKHRLIRRAYRPFVSHYVALSGDLAGYLANTIGVPGERVTRLCNGVDTQRFRPAAVRTPIPGCPFLDPDQWIVGTIGRMQTVKAQADLVRAFARAIALDPALKSRLRLVLVGDGPQFGEVAAAVAAAGLGQLVWLPGERNDVADILRGLDCFVLPSLFEGISNVILEAMASGLPVIATAVGGNSELIDAGRSGQLVPAADAEAMAQAILSYASSPESARTAGRTARLEAERRFSLEAMMRGYGELYGRLLGVGPSGVQKCAA
jgi:sugar transferase (PEP-CTERM/EpsH1 system associated)